MAKVDVESRDGLERYLDDANKKEKWRVSRKEDRRALCSMVVEVCALPKVLCKDAESRM